MKLGNINIKLDGLQPLAKIRSSWPIFRGPMISCYNSKAFWHIFMKLGNIYIKWDGLQPLAKIISPWPIFHGPVIFLYNSKAFWHIFMKLWNISIKWDVLQLLDKSWVTLIFISWSNDFQFITPRIFYIYLWNSGNIDIKWDVLTTAYTNSVIWPVFHAPMIFLYNSKDFLHIFMKPGNINIKQDGL